MEQTELAQGEKPDTAPGRRLAPPQAPLPGLCQPKLHPGRTQADVVAIAKYGLAHRFIVHRNQRVTERGQAEAFVPFEIKAGVLVPDPGRIKLEVCAVTSADAERKTAGHPPGTRLSAGKDAELNHYHQRRGTDTLSPGMTRGSSLGSFRALTQLTVNVEPSARVNCTFFLFAKSVKSPAT